MNIKSPKVKKNALKQKVVAVYKICVRKVMPIPLQLARVKKHTLDSTRKHNHINNTARPFFLFLFVILWWFFSALYDSYASYTPRLLLIYFLLGLQNWPTLKRNLHCFSLSPNLTNKRISFSMIKTKSNTQKIIIVDPNISFLLRTDKIPFSIPLHTNVIIVAYPVTFLWRLDLKTKFICCWAMALQG